MNHTDSNRAGRWAGHLHRPAHHHLHGEKFPRGLVTPIDPKAVFSLLQSGYAGDFILALTVDSLNGVCNRTATPGSARAPDPEFVRVLELLRDVQAAGAFALRVEGDNTIYQWKSVKCAPPPEPDVTNDCPTWDKD